MTKSLRIIGMVALAALIALALVVAWPGVFRVPSAY